MILWFLFYVVFVIGGLMLFIHLTMPPALRTIKITKQGLIEAMEMHMLEQQATIDSIKDNLKPRTPS